VSGEGAVKTCQKTQDVEFGVGSDRDGGLHLRVLSDAMIDNIKHIIIIIINFVHSLL